MRAFNTYCVTFVLSLSISINAGGAQQGDFDGNGVIDVADLDYFWDCYECLDRRLDIDGDGASDTEDFRILVEDLANTYFGDANVDGEFNSSDFVAVFTAGKYETGFPGNASWSDGDWNGDRDFNSADLVIAFVGDGYELGPRPPRPLHGDFSGNGILDVNDINMLLIEIASGHGEGFDLNDDGNINRDDIQVWVTELKNTYLGDANLNGEFGTDDLVLAFQGGKFEKNLEALWHEGDWTGDLRFDSADFVAAFVDSGNCVFGGGGGYECGPRPRPGIVVVPEPRCCAHPMLLFLVVLLFARPKPPPRADCDG